MTETPTAEALIAQIASVARGVGWQANVGASEIAGQIVSRLAKHPEFLAAHNQVQAIKRKEGIR